jgi:kynureninase
VPYKSKLCKIIKTLFSFKVDLNLIENPDDDCIYLCGNSLGLLPKASRQKVMHQFDKWSEM